MNVNKWFKYIINEKKTLNEEKKYISTEVLSKYDLGEDGEEQLFSLLTSGAFTVDELKKILRDLHKESHKNFMAYQTAMPGDEIEFEDDSYISPSDEDFEAEANYAEKAGGLVDDLGKPISREEWKQYYERDKKQAAANDKYGQLIMRYGKIRGVIEKAIKQI